MANLNNLIYTASEFKVFLGILGGKTYPILTAETIGQSISVEEELIYVVGEEDAQGNKQNSRSVKGKLAMQLGEMDKILKLEGLQDATRINGATIAVTAIKGGFARVYKNVNINMEDFAIKAKDKQSIINMDFTALSMV